MNCDLHNFTAGYIEAALWTEEVEFEDLPEYIIREMTADCYDFVKKAGSLLAGLDAEQAGHDFWLTRNGHGAGFWERNDKIGERLTALCHEKKDFYIHSKHAKHEG